MAGCHDATNLEEGMETSVVPGNGLGAGRCGRGLEHPRTGKHTGIVVCELCRGARSVRRNRRRARAGPGPRAIDRGGPSCRWYQQRSQQDDNERRAHPYTSG